MGATAHRPDEAHDDALALARRRGGGEASLCYALAGPPDRRLRYVESGKGPLLLFVHGFPSFWYAWQRQLDALQTDYHVVAIDALGAGGSAKPGEDAAYRVPLLADDVDRVADAAGGQRRFVLVGHDWGAALAFAYAQARPERLAGVVGLSAPPFNQFLDLFARDPEQRQRSGYMERLRALTLARIEGEALAPAIAHGAYAGLAQCGAIDAEEFALLRSVVGQPRALHGGSAWYRANLPDVGEPGSGQRWPRDDAAIAVPSLLIWGDDDPAFVGTFPDAFASRHAGSAVLRLPTVGHWPMLEAAGEVTEAISEFAARVLP